MVQVRSGNRGTIETIPRTPGLWVPTGWLPRELSLKNVSAEGQLGPSSSLGGAGGSPAAEPSNSP